MIDWWSAARYPLQAAGYPLHAFHHFTLFTTSQHHHIVRLQLQRRKRIFACQKAKKKGVEENRTTSGTKIPLAMIITTPYIIQDWTVQ